MSSKNKLSECPISSGKYAKYQHDESCKTLEQCRSHVDDWLEHRKAMSASTQKLDASSLAKIFGCSTTEFLKTNARLRKNIKRSRGKKKMDAHFSEKKNWELVEFSKSVGLRRAELSALYGNCLKEEDGQCFVIVQSGSKGGKYREAPVTRMLIWLSER